MTHRNHRPPPHRLTQCALLSALFACNAPRAQEGTEERLAALEKDVAALKQQLAALNAAPRMGAGASSAREDEADAGASIRPLEKATVGFIFDVTPRDATIKVDGTAIEALHWSGDRHSGFHTVKVSRPGFRTLVQQVSSDESQRLSYRLVRGRGVAHVPPR